MSNGKFSEEVISPPLRSMIDESKDDPKGFWGEVGSVIIQGIRIPPFLEISSLSGLVSGRRSGICAEGEIETWTTQEMDRKTRGRDNRDGAHLAASRTLPRTLWGIESASNA